MADARPPRAMRLSPPPRVPGPPEGCMPPLVIAFLAVLTAALTGIVWRY